MNKRVLMGLIFMLGGVANAGDFNGNLDLKAIKESLNGVISTMPSGFNPNYPQYPNQYPQQYPNQYPNQYPPQYPQQPQYPQYPNQYPQQPQYPPQQGQYVYGEVCQTFTFTPQSGNNAGPYTLRSPQYIRQQIPTSEGGTTYQDTPTGQYAMKNVSINISNRQLYPWERQEQFTVCAQGERTYIRQNGVFRYSENVRDTGYDATYYLSPASNRLTQPDPEGMSLRYITSTQNPRNIQLAISDRWYQYYQGGQTAIHIKLRKNGGLWGVFSPEVANKVMLFTQVGPEYVVNLTELLGSQLNQLEAGQYFVEWSFQRRGTPQVSTDNEIGKGCTNAVSI